MSTLATVVVLVATLLAPGTPAWKALPVLEPRGEKQSTGSYTVADPLGGKGKRPPVADEKKGATGPETAKDTVPHYNPIPAREGGKSMVEYLKANDPVEYSHILANVARDASWGYVNYDIVDVVTVDGYPIKTDGFRYTDDSFLEVRKTEKWQPATISYRRLLEENRLVERGRQEGITEIWLWGWTGMHFDEFAMFIPNRYARFGPTDNPWLYRPYDIPEELGRTTWVMGFNYEVGADNMIHSFAHRVESMAALALADGVWDPSTRRDPWNVFSWLELDHSGTPSQVGNVHVPPNGQSGYDYNNARRVVSGADAWFHYPH